MQKKTEIESTKLKVGKMVIALALCLSLMFAVVALTACGGDEVFSAPNGFYYECDEGGVHSEDRHLQAFFQIDGTEVSFQADAMSGHLRRVGQIVSDDGKFFFRIHGQSYEASFDSDTGIITVIMYSQTRFFRRWDT